MSILPENFFTHRGPLTKKQTNTHTQQQQHNNEQAIVIPWICSNLSEARFMKSFKTLFQKLTDLVCIILRLFLGKGSASLKTLT